MDLALGLGLGRLNTFCGAELPQLHELVPPGQAIEKTSLVSARLSPSVLFFLAFFFVVVVGR